MLAVLYCTYSACMLLCIQRLKHSISMYIHVYMCTYVHVYAVYLHVYLCSASKRILIELIDTNFSNVLSS